MNILLENIGKRYRYEWIFRQLNYEFRLGESYAILGHNGSGKSTLMQVLSGYLSPSEGKISFGKGQEKVELEAVYQQVSFASPYMGVLEEFSLLEALDFHHKFKAWQADLSTKTVLEMLQLPKSAQQKPLKYFSSGMKQRVKLALAILSKTSVLLLDEPTITLDNQGVEWYQEILKEYGCLPNRLVIVASNVEEDYVQCRQQLSLLDFKK